MFTSFVFDHPFFDVTETDGAFEITGVAPGTQKLVLLMPEAVGYVEGKRSLGAAIEVKAVKRSTSATSRSTRRRSRRSKKSLGAPGVLRKQAARPTFCAETFVPSCPSAADRCISFSKPRVATPLENVSSTVRRPVRGVPPAPAAGESGRGG